MGNMMESVFETTIVWGNWFAVAEIVTLQKARITFPPTITAVQMQFILLVQMVSQFSDEVASF